MSTPLFFEYVALIQLYKSNIGLKRSSYGLLYRWVLKFPSCSCSRNERNVILCGIFVTNRRTRDSALDETWKCTQQKTNGCSQTHYTAEHNQHIVCWLCIQRTSRVVILLPDKVASNSVLCSLKMHLFPFISSTPIFIQKIHLFPFIFFFTEAFAFIYKLFPIEKYSLYSLEGYLCFPVILVMFNIWIFENSLLKCFGQFSRRIQ